MSRPEITPGQIYTTCRGGATSTYPETVIVRALDVDARTVEATGEASSVRHTIPASYFHATATTAAGKPRRTGYYLTGTL
ncbi:hypothetical protein [Kitasatospora cheerisanensis]|uniref:Uncharacterized protein n=1 Tax=Kitasatospora cheerisanensis KCTC 2395 TaxID=1348663 RepID=A0A066YRG5_9ACTN|nr:hypothetical protein [Kitasatospora cheerisanensis]KDN80525.1 hypothetical protein KCH_76720 [Kitasatospora cheerisanensis KCTC 2395]